VRSLRRVRWPLLALVALIVLLAIGYAVSAVHHGSPRSSTSASTGSQRSAPGSGRGAGSLSTGSAVEVPLSSLPTQVSATVDLILQGGPFPYRQDGVVFANAERHLPIEARGYYHEFTVPTPGSADRGGRRIITGLDGEFYYTADHYESFHRVDVTR
jgi:ribonuclease T1